MAIESKGWKWEIVTGKREEYWRRPSEISYYLMQRWGSEGKKDFLDLGCGLGRHTVLFAQNGFDVHAMDINEESLKKTKEWADELKLDIELKQGDFLKLPYEDESIDCILSFHVMNHTDTEGIRQALSEIHRVLCKGGECYLTLGSKDHFAWNTDDPKIDANTNLRQEEGPEHNVPHFYADIDLVTELFKDFDIKNVHQEINYMRRDDGERDNGKKSAHFHLLFQK